MGERFMEGKGDSSLTQTKPDDLPANGRPVGRASKLVGLGVAAAAVVSGCFLPSWLVGINSNPSPRPSGIVEPSPTGGMPSASTPIEVTPLPSPTNSPSVGPSQTPEVTASPDAHEQLITKLQNFISGKDENGKPFIFPKGKFSEYLNSSTPLPENIINTENTKIDLTQPAVANNAQGVLLGEEEVLNSKTNIKSLVAYIGFESKSADPNAKNFYVPVNLGRVGMDTDELDNWNGVIWNAPSKTAEKLSVLDMEKKLQGLNGQNILIGFAIYNGDMLTMLQQPDQPGEGRSRREYLEQINLSKALATWMEKTVNTPYQNVPMDNSIKDIINHPVTDLKTIIPSTGNIVQYPYNLN